MRITRSNRAGKLGFVAQPGASLRQMAQGSTVRMLAPKENQCVPVWHAACNTRFCPRCTMHEKFSTVQVAMLRSDLAGAGLDSFQIAETIKMFMATHGYGISAQTAREMATRFDGRRDGVEALRRELEASALMM